MSIVFEHGIDLPQTPGAVFACLDDFKRVPLWLKRCEGVAKQGQGPNKVGDKLRYAYAEGGKHRIMDGVIAAYEPDRQLSYRYYDKMMQVFVDFQMEAQGPGTRLTHRIEIVPNSFLAKLMSPLFRMKVPKQTVVAMENLRQLLATEEAVSAGDIGEY